eukprot:4220365-Pleurochrysis_carterae.AAC.1
MYNSATSRRSHDGIERKPCIWLAYERWADSKLEGQRGVERQFWCRRQAASGAKGVACGGNDWYRSNVGMAGGWIGGLVVYAPLSVDFRILSLVEHQIVVVSAADEHTSAAVLIVRTSRKGCVRM